MTMMRIMMMMMKKKTTSSMTMKMMILLLIFKLKIGLEAQGQNLDRYKSYEVGAPAAHLYSYHFFVDRCFMTYKYRECKSAIKL